MVTPELLLPDKTTQWYSYQIGISNSKCNNTFSDSEPVVASNKASKTRKLNRHYLILLSRLLPEKKETKSRESKKVTVVKLNHLILTYSPLSSEEYAESFSPYTSIWGKKTCLTVEKLQLPLEELLSVQCHGLCIEARPRMTLCCYKTARFSYASRAILMLSSLWHDHLYVVINTEEGL